MDLHTSGTRSVSRSHFLPQCSKLNSSPKARTRFNRVVTTSYVTGVTGSVICSNSKSTKPLMGVVHEIPASKYPVTVQSSPMCLSPRFVFAKLQAPSNTKSTPRSSAAPACPYACLSPHTRSTALSSALSSLPQSPHSYTPHLPAPFSPTSPS